MGAFIGGGGSRHVTAEEAAEYMSQSPHRAVLMRLTKELEWDDVHRYEVADAAKLGDQLWSLEFLAATPPSVVSTRAAELLSQPLRQSSPMAQFALHHVSLIVTDLPPSLACGEMDRAGARNSDVSKCRFGSGKTLSGSG